MSKFNKIAAFIAVAEENSFAAAARKQKISTAAISRQISQLESDLQVVLLHRTTRKISLTEIGLQYYLEAKKAIEGLLEAEKAILGNQDICTGTLRITSNRYFASHHIIPRLSEFIAQNPALKINLELAERFPSFADEDIDLIFGVSMPGSLDLVQRKIGTTRYVLCASPTYLKIHGIPLTPADLSKHHYITHNMRDPNDILIFKDEQRVYVKPSLWLNDSRAMCDCALLDMGIVKLHDYIVASELQKGSLVEILQTYQEPVQPIYLYYQQSKYLQPKIRRFIDFYT